MVLLQKHDLRGNLGAPPPAFANPASRRSTWSDGFYHAFTRWRFILLTQFLDIAVIVLVSLLVYGVAARPGRAFMLHDLSGSLIVAALSHFSFFQGQLYDMEMLMDPLRSAKTLGMRWTFIFMMLAAGAALAHQPGLLSRAWFGGFYATGMAALTLERLTVARLIRGWIARGHHVLCVAIVGGNALAEGLIERFRNNRWGIRIIGVFDDRSRDHVSQVAGVQMLGTVADLLEYSKYNEVDTAVITLPITASARMRDVIRQLRQLPIDVCILPGAIGLERVSPIRLARTALPGVQLIAVTDRPISEFALFVKTMFDRLGAATALILLSPLFAFCAAGIRLNSPGPVFFQQQRIGYKGRDFDIFKFRTMHAAAQPDTELTTRNDPRVFRFGSLLRKLSLDELPQLINVLRGDMSLVGPRPHMAAARAAGQLYFDAVQEYSDRQRVKPGITGWAQVNGWRGPTETIEQIERRVEYDIYYIENWSLLFDIIIIFKTIVAGFYGKNAF